MRFFKSYIRHKIISKSDKIDVFLQNFTQNKKELLENALNEIINISTEKMDAKILKELLVEKINALNIDMSASELESLYLALGNKAIKKLGETGIKGAKFSFDSVDKNAINAMRKSFYWLGKEYNENLQTRLKNLIEKHFNGEIALDEIPRKLKDEFDGIINADENYFKGVGDHISLQSENIARIIQGEKYAVKYYKVLAIMDARTSEICRSMNGRIIQASHLQNQANRLLNAKNMADKKAAAIWQSAAFNASKMPVNFGLPPYHFRCRSEVVPVWIDESEVDGVMMRNTSPLSKDEVIKHIDKIGVERVLSRQRWEHIKSGHSDIKKSDIIKALNSIQSVAPNIAIKNRINTISSNGVLLYIVAMK